RAEGAAVFDLVLAQRRLHVALRRLPLGAEPPARDRARRVALDVRHLAILDVDELAAADGAVRADRLDDVLRLVDARRQPLRALRLGGRAEPELVSLPELPDDRPALDQPCDSH